MKQDLLYSNLRSECLQIAHSAISSVSSYKLLYQALTLALSAGNKPIPSEPSNSAKLGIDSKLPALRLVLNNQSFVVRHNVYVAAFGKCVLGMVRAVEEILGPHVVRGVAIIPTGTLSRLRSTGKSEWLPGPGWHIEVYEGSRANMPDDDAMRAAALIRDLVKTLDHNDLLFCCISGGGSALLPLPVPPVTLAEKALATCLLSRAGCSIHELNAVRTQLSQLKGGRLARLAAPAHTLAFVLSDVLGDGLDVIASGPCFIERQHKRLGPGHASGAKRALEIVNSKSLASQMPPNVMTALEAQARTELMSSPEGGLEQLASIESLTDPARAAELVQHVLIGNNRVALQAAAEFCEKKLGYGVFELTNRLSGDVHAAGNMLTALALFIFKWYESESGGSRSMLASAECCDGGACGGAREEHERERDHEHQSRTRALGEWRHRPCFLPLRANLPQLEFQLLRSGIPKATVNALLDRAKKTLLFDRRPLVILLGGETTVNLMRPFNYGMSSSLLDLLDLKEPESSGGGPPRGAESGTFASEPPTSVRWQNPPKSAKRYLRGSVSIPGGSSVVGLRGVSGSAATLPFAAASASASASESVPSSATASRSSRPDPSRRPLSPLEQDNREEDTTATETKTATETEIATATETTAPIASGAQSQGNEGATASAGGSSSSSESTERASERDTPIATAAAALGDSSPSPPPTGINRIREGRGGRCQHLALYVTYMLDRVLDRDHFLATYHKHLPLGIALELLVTSTDGADGNTDSTGAVVDLLTAFNARRYGFMGRPSGENASGSNSLTSSTPSTSSSSHNAALSGPGAGAGAGAAAQQVGLGAGLPAPEAQAAAPRTESSSGGHRHVLFQMSGSSSSETPPTETDTVFADPFRSRSVDAGEYLARYDSNTFFSNYRGGECLINYDYTDTNVMDIIALVIRPTSV